MGKRKRRKETKPKGTKADRMMANLQPGIYLSMFPKLISQHQNRLLVLKKTEEETHSLSLCRNIEEAKSNKIKTHGDLWNTSICSVLFHSAVRVFGNQAQII